MHYYKATIQYEGTNYAGFQWQNGLHTVQSEFNRALSELLVGKTTTRAASRTDTGVHANEQIVKISSEAFIDCSSFLQPFNNKLPTDINCFSIQPCEGTFKPAANASSKEYRYFFTNKKQVVADERTFVANISNDLNFEAIKICLQALVGKHDFCNFYSAGSNVKSTVREIFICELSEIDPRELFCGSKIFLMPENLDKCYQLRIEANGFLKQMIRHIVSALWMVGSGKISVEDFLSLIDGPKSAKQRWKVAPPNGLFLYRIHYLS